MRGSFRAVRKTSLAFDLLKKYLTYPRLLRQFIQEASLLFLEVTKARTGGHTSLLFGQGSFWHCTPIAMHTKFRNTG